MNKTTEPAAPEPLSLGNTKGIHTQAVAGLELIYQVWNTSDYPSHWADTDKILYDVYAKDDRRIVYSAATVERLVQERNGWIDSAKHFSNGMEYYRDQLDACARHIGLPCFTADDGGVHEEPLRAKVTEEVQRLVQERDELNATIMHMNDVCNEQLAASQAREQQLREMWQKVEAEYFSRLKEQDDLTANFEAEKEMYGWNFHKGLRGGLVEFHIYMTKIAKALSLPQDDTALKAWGAKLLREIADGCRDGIDRAWITSKADELMEEKGNG